MLLAPRYLPVSFFKTEVGFLKLFEIILHIHAELGLNLILCSGELCYQPTGTKQKR